MDDYTEKMERQMQRIYDSLGELELTCQRKKGEGRKLVTESNPLLVKSFLKFLSDHTAGDPMREDVKWTNLSRRQISCRLKEQGTPAEKMSFRDCFGSRDTVVANLSKN